MTTKLTTAQREWRAAARKSLEDALETQLKQAGNRELLRYWRDQEFLTGRRYRADFQWEAVKLIVEIDGGQWTQNSGHNSGSGKERDCERDAEAILAGWTILRFTTNMIADGRALKIIERFFAMQPHPALRKNYYS